MSSLSRAEILARLAPIIAKSLHIDAARVTEDAYLSDLGAESLDLIEITMGIEEAFDIWVPEKSILQTAREVYGEGVLEKEGVLTQEGKDLLRARMPELSAESLSGEVTMSAVNREFMRVSGWVRMIESFVDATPQVCAACGGPLGRALAYKRKCVACGTENALKPGEEVNKRWVLDYQAATARSAAQ
ncbi:MAG: hypothetical protein FJW31_21630 [Acidobacteria bacterium]|nr:hypothetical protein [Acidobacteriota bacterium]